MISEIVLIVLILTPYTHSTTTHGKKESNKNITISTKIIQCIKDISVVLYNLAIILQKVGGNGLLL